MALAALPLFSNRPCRCSSSITSFPSYSPNPSNFRQPSTFFPHLQTQPFISPLIKSQPPKNNYFLFQFRPSIHCRYTSHTLNADFQFAKIVSLFEEIGIGLEETKLLLRKAPELTSIQLDSLRDRVLYLQSLGLERMSINHLVTEQLNVLTSNDIDPLLNFLRNELQGEVEEDKLKLLLSTNDPKKLSDFPQKVQLLLDYGIAVDKIAYVLNKVNLSKAICQRSMEEIERLISFLKPFGGVDLIPKRPSILNFDLEVLKPRIRVLTELSRGDVVGVGKVMYKFPVILNYSEEHLQGHIEFLRSFVELDDQQIFRIVLVFPPIFTNSRERKLRPRIQFLKDCGLDPVEIFKLLIKAPVYLSISFHDNLANKLALLIKIGYKYRTKEFAMLTGAASRASSPNMQKVLSLLLNYGLSADDIFAMCKRHPQILQYNHASLEKKMKYLIEVMDRDVQELLDFPAYLGYRLDERIKFRYELKKGSLERNMSLNQLLSVSTEDFGAMPKKASVKSKLK